MGERLAGCRFCWRTEWVLLRAAECFVQLDDAPIVEGHVLIMPNAHHPSLADAPVHTAMEVDQLSSLIRSLYLETYGSFALFEHGRTGHCFLRSQDEHICHHAHVHALPLHADLVAEISLGQRTLFNSWAEVAELAADLDGYLIAESSGGNRYFYPVTRSLPSHYLRTVAARLSGHEARADWEKLLNTERSMQLIRRANARLAQSLRDLWVMSNVQCL